MSTNWGKWAIHALVLKNGRQAWEQFYKASNLVCAKADLKNVLKRSDCTSTGGGKIIAARICYGEEHPEVRTGKRIVGEIRMEERLD